MIEEQRLRSTTALSRRERFTTLALGGTFLAAAVAFAVVGPWQRPLSPLLLLVLLGAYVAAASVKFEVGTGIAIPTQLVLVPMLFLLPIAIVPLAVATGLLLASVPESVRARVPSERGLAPLASCWHSFGPAAVFAAASVSAPTWSELPIYAAALGAQFALDAGSSAVADRLALGPLPPGYAPAFAWVFLIDVCLAPIGLAIAFAGADEPAAAVLVLPLLVLLGVFSRERHARLDNAIELTTAYRGTALLLGDVIEADDEYTGSHSRDVVELVLDVADVLGLDAESRRRAEFTALLHDIGKIRIPSSIINKPGPLTPAERTVVETHTVEGETLLAGVGGVLGDVGHLVRSCHERWDGKGYPDGLLADEIPLIARIVAVCDAFSAMSTDRSYRRALDPAAVEQELRAHAGTQFDPAVVAALLRVLRAADPAGRGDGNALEARPLEFAA